MRQDLGGYYARDTHRGDIADDNYAREGGWSGGGRADDYVRIPRPSYRGRGPKNWRPSDERIREAVNEALTDAHEVDATDIEVSVSEGDVTLSGTVNSRREKRMAEDVAWACAGVHDVHSRLVVS